MWSNANNYERYVNIIHIEAAEPGIEVMKIRKEVNGIKIGTTVDSAYDLIIEQKSKKRKGVKNIITLTILR